MSLNGLDDAQVKEAHEAAVAEAGGWYVCFFFPFLSLSHTTRADDTQNPRSRISRRIRRVI